MKKLIISATLAALCSTTCFAQGGLNATTRIITAQEAMQIKLDQVRFEQEKGQKHAQKKERRITRRGDRTGGDGAEGAEDEGSVRRLRPVPPVSPRLPMPTKSGRAMPEDSAMKQGERERGRPSPQEREEHRAKREERLKSLPPEKQEAAKKEMKRHREEMRKIVGEKPMKDGEKGQDRSNRKANKAGR